MQIKINTARCIVENYINSFFKINVEEIFKLIVPDIRIKVIWKSYTRRFTMEKMRMETVDMTAQNVETIGKLFPNCITETVEGGGTEESH